MAPDKYDKAIAYLTEHPNEIEEAWGAPSEDSREPKDFDHEASALFTCLPNGCGCLTQIRDGSKKGPAVIAQDERIPKKPQEITVADLPVFAEWQRRVDAGEIS